MWLNCESIKRSSMHCKWSHKAYERTLTKHSIMLELTICRSLDFLFFGNVQTGFETLKISSNVRLGCAETYPRPFFLPRWPINHFYVPFVFAFLSDRHQGKSKEYWIRAKNRKYYLLHIITQEGVCFVLLDTELVHKYVMCTIDLGRKCFLRSEFFKELRLC